MWHIHNAKHTHHCLPIIYDVYVCGTAAAWPGCTLKDQCSTSFKKKKRKRKSYRILPFQSSSSSTEHASNTVHALWLFQSMSCLNTTITDLSVLTETMFVCFMVPGLNASCRVEHNRFCFSTQRRYIFMFQLFLPVRATQTKAVS